MSKHDITSYKETGTALVKRISREINDKDAYILVPIPDTLVMTKDQHNSLISSDDLEFMQEFSELTNELKPSNTRMFNTGKYVLEVEVVETK